MKALLLSVLVLISGCPALMAQQAPVDERTATPYEYPAFKDATVTMMFGSRKHVKGNVYLDGSKFYFMQGQTSIEADLSNIRSIRFGDSLYVPVNATTVGYVVAQDSNKMLVCVRTIDQYEMNERDKHSEGLAFAQLEGFSGVLEMDNREAMERAKKFPVQREYLFRIDGQWIPAKEGPVLDRYDRSKRLMLRGMTENRYWSWTDEQSLAQLLPLL